MEVNYAKWFILCYMLSGCLSFGYAMNNLQHIGPKERDDSAARVFVATVAGIVWPLYMSVKLFEKEVEP